MRLVDVDALDVVGTVIPSGVDTKSYVMGMEYILNKIDGLPTIEERKTGEWNTDKESPEYATCSVCGHCDWDCTESEYFNFCPNCGADMRGGQDE